MATSPAKALSLESSHNLFQDPDVTKEGSPGDRWDGEGRGKREADDSQMPVRLMSVPELLSRTDLP